MPTPFRFTHWARWGLALTALAVGGCADTEEDLRDYVHERMGPLLAQEAALIGDFNRLINDSAEDEERAARIAQYLSDELLPRYAAIERQMAAVINDSRRVRRLHQRYLALAAAQRKDFEELQMTAAAAARALDDPEPAAPQVRRHREEPEPPVPEPPDQPPPLPSRTLAEINASLTALAGQRAVWEEDLRTLCRKYDVGASR